jgi:competence protein ComEA
MRAQSVFQWSKGERMGLCWIMFFLLSWYSWKWGLRPLLYPKQQVSLSPEQWSNVEQWIATREAHTNLTEQDQTKLQTPENYQKLPRRPQQFFRFNPNQISLAEWEALGLSTKQAQALLNYRKAGGVFRKWEDLQKMYTIPKDLLALWRPYVDLPEVLPAAGNSHESKSYSFSDGQDRQHSGKQEDKTIPLLVSLNKADSLDLLAIPGIGPVFASRILRYRSRLGGFAEAEQLLQVYGMDSLRWQRMLPYINIDTLAIKKIPINSVDVVTLGRHPLIGFKKAEQLIRYRSVHGPFHSLSDLYSLETWEPTFIRIIAPYLQFESWSKD